MEKMRQTPTGRARPNELPQAAKGPFDTALSTIGPIAAIP
jgi:hypothetical protein